MAPKTAVLVASAGAAYSASLAFTTVARRAAAPEPALRGSQLSEPRTSQGSGASTLAASLAAGALLTVAAGAGARRRQVRQVACQYKSKYGQYTVVDKQTGKEVLVDNVGKETIIDVATRLGVFKTLLAALEKAKLTDALKAPGDFVIFAPTDEAFNAFLAENKLTAEQLLNSPDLAKILKHHVIAYPYLRHDVYNGYITTLAGTNLSISDKVDTCVFGGADLLETDPDPCNGAIYFIDRVLKPNTIVDVAVAAGAFTTLVAAAKKAGLVEALSGPGPFTVFAPSDDAFKAFLAKKNLTAEQLLNSPELGRILKHHVLAQNLAANQIPKGRDRWTTLANTNIFIDKDDKGVRVAGANVVTAGVVAGNGIIHVIDDVLEPTSTVVDLLVGNDHFTTLVAAVKKANLVEALSGPGPFTVFAPTDDAFKAFLAEKNLTAEQLLNHPDLAKILKHHVVAGNVPRSLLQLKPVQTTLAGTQLEVDKEGKLSGAGVGGADAAANGIIHVIDHVLMP